MLTVILGTEINQDGFYYKSEDELDSLKRDIHTYQIYKDNQLIYERDY